VNNAVRHSGCRRAEVELRRSDDRIVLEVRDDGRGFDPERELEGHGLDSMSRRARGLGGRVTVESRPGGGTTVRLEFPLRGRPWWRPGRSLPA
jgi:signal transduction histidine kinase